MTETTLFGFNGSTFVRTVRCVLARKSISYNQVPVNVLEGETQEPDHLERHPFGKVPVLDIDGMNHRCFPRMQKNARRRTRTLR